MLAVRMARAALTSGRKLAALAAAVDPEAGRLVRRANVLLASAAEVLARRTEEERELRKAARDQHARRVLDRWREGRVAA